MIEQILEEIPILEPLFDVGILGIFIFILYKIVIGLLDYLKGRNVVEEKDQDKESISAQANREMVAVLGIMAESMRAIPEEMKQDRVQRNIENESFLERLEANTTLIRELTNKITAEHNTQTLSIQAQNSEMANKMNTIDELNGKLDGLIKQTADTTQALVNLENTLNVAITRLNGLIESKVNEFKDEMGTIRGDISEIQTKTERLRGEIDKEKNKITEETTEQNNDIQTIEGVENGN